jgi:hypothetical protein
LRIIFYNETLYGGDLMDFREMYYTITKLMSEGKIDPPTEKDLKKMVQNIKKRKKQKRNEL